MLAGNFEHALPSDAQLATLKEIVARLDAVYHFERIIGHRDSKATACPGAKLEEWMIQNGILRNWDMGSPYHITRYYSPEPDQLVYYDKRTYLEDVEMNCGLTKEGAAGDCSTTANGYKLKASDAFKVAACPPDMPFGTRLHIEGIGELTCVDRGGAIKDKRIDVWAGYGMDGLRNIAQNKVAGTLSVRRIK